MLLVYCTAVPRYLFPQFELFSIPEKPIGVRVIVAIVSAIHFLLSSNFKYMTSWQPPLVQTLHLHNA